MSVSYKVTVNGWKKHNAKHKESYKYFKFRAGFFSDNSISQLTQNETLLYINLLCIACDSSSDSYTITARSLPKSLRMHNKLLYKSLMRLESFQLVSVEKSESLLIKVKENKSKESKVKGEQVELFGTTPPKTEAPKTSSVIAFYCDTWKARYKTEKNPYISKKDAGLIHNLVKGAGADKAKEYIKAYLQMPDPWFIKRRHDIPTMCGNMNSITQFLDNGKMITNKDLKHLEQKIQTDNLMKMVDEGEI